jgi:gamma-glutamylcyclotransferase (GGCT)/AIG2-like uncharacterized protein YtfP
LNVAIYHFFVYGTLKRGECREKCWPRPPLQVESAWVRGELYDTGPYPALRPGNDPVLGEVWSYPAHDLAIVTRVLDEIEEYCEGRIGNLYTRETIECQTFDGRQFIAQTYVYAQTIDRPTFQRRLPTVDVGGQRFAYWTKRVDQSPSIDF